MEDKPLIKLIPWWGWVMIALVAIAPVLIGSTGYIIYNKQNEEKNRLLDEVSSLRNEVENLNSEMEEAKIDIDNLSGQNENASQAIERQDNQIDKEEVCRQENDLLLEIKQACDIKPFPGIDECIEEMESTLEYLGEENYKKYHMDEKVNNLKELRSRYLPLKNQCGE